jgi:hypothetical protein
VTVSHAAVGPRRSDQTALMENKPDPARQPYMSKDNIYSASVLIANLSSPSDYHILESAIQNATRSTKDRLVIILHSPAFANQEVPRANWFEIQRLLTWVYVKSTAVAQDMDKVLLDTDVLLRPPHTPTVEGTTKDGDLLEKAGALYVFKEGGS